MTKVSPITSSQHADLVSGDLAQVCHGHAALECATVGSERRFIMRGQTGIHTLLCEATDLDRLNAHWAGFAGHDLNQLRA